MQSVQLAGETLIGNVPTILSLDFKSSNHKNPLISIVNLKLFVIRINF